MEAMADPEKPHRGRIEPWFRLTVGSRYAIAGVFLDHPDWPGRWALTSEVLSYDEKTGEIETMNSRYTLVGPPVSPPVSPS